MRRPLPPFVPAALAAAAPVAPVPAAAADRPLRPLLRDVAAQVDLGNTPAERDRRRSRRRREAQLRRPRALPGGAPDLAAGR